MRTADPAAAAVADAAAAAEDEEFAPLKAWLLQYCPKAAAAAKVARQNAALRGVTAQEEKAAPILMLRREPRHFTLASALTCLVGLALRRAGRSDGGSRARGFVALLARLIGNALLATSGLAVLLRVAWSALRFPRGPLRRSGPSPGKLAALRTCTTHYRLRGAAHGPLVVLVHGFCGEAAHLDGVAEALLDAGATSPLGVRVLQFDTVGRGHSECPGRQAHRIELFVQQLLEVIEHALADGVGEGAEVGVGAVHLVGYSMGGAIAAAFTERYPARVGSLSLIAPAGAHERPPPRVVRVPLLSEVLWAVQGGGFLAGTDGAAGQWRDPWGAAASAERLRFERRLALEPALLRSTLSTMQHFAFGAAAEGVWRAVGKDAKRPVLIVWGTDDATCPFSGAAALCKLLPRAELVALDGAGHCAPLEPDGAVADAVAKFVTQAMARGPGDLG